MPAADIKHDTTAFIQNRRALYLPGSFFRIELLMAHTERESVIVRFGHPEGERLEFAFAGSELERFQSSPDDWIRAAGTVAVGGFRGDSELWFMSADFAGLLPELRELYETLRGDVDFKTTEDQVGFRLNGDGRGHIELRGHFLDRIGDGNRLDFTLNFDQSLLRHSIAQIGDLVAAIGIGKGA